MLYPTVELYNEQQICTCGMPNFRHITEWYKPIKKIYKLTLPNRPYGETTHYLCEDCIKKIYGAIKDERCNTEAACHDTQKEVVECGTEE